MTLHKGEERHFHQLAVKVNQNAHFHRNQVKNPRNIAELIRQLAGVLNIIATPHTFKVNRLATERVLCQACCNFLQIGTADYIHCSILIAGNIVIDAMFLKQLSTQRHGKLKVYIVRSALGFLDGTSNRVAEVLPAARMRTKHHFFRRYIQINNKIDGWKKLLAGCAHAIENNDFAVLLCLCTVCKCGSNFLCIHQICKLTVEKPPIEKDRVFYAISWEIVGELFLQHICRQTKIGRGQKRHLFAFQQACNAIGKLLKIRGGIALNRNNAASLFCLLLRDCTGQSLHDFFRAKGRSAFDLIRNCRTVYRSIIVIGMGIKHKTHSEVSPLLWFLTVNEIGDKGTQSRIENHDQ